MVILRVITSTSEQAKICNYRSLSSQESAIFMMTSQEEWFTELMYCKCKLLLYSFSTLTQKCLHIVASTMPKRWVAAVTREVIAIDRFRVVSTTKWSLKKSQRDCMHSSGVCQKYSRDLISVVFQMAVHANDGFQWLSQRGGPVVLFWTCGHWRCMHREKTF